MAPQPAKTNVLYVRYEGSFGTRTVQCRFSDATSSSAAASAFRTWLLAGVEDIWKTTTAVTQWSWRVKGSTFSLPIGSPGAVVGLLTGALSPVEYPRYVTFTGRGLTTGKQVRMFIFGLDFATPGDYRFTLTENGPVKAAWDALPALVAAGGFVTEGGDAPQPRIYANVGYNSYYERKSRGSA